MKVKDHNFKQNHPHRTSFVTMCLAKGFTVKMLSDMTLSASKKNKDGVNIRFQVTPFDFDFCDGGNKEPKVQVFENGYSNSNLTFRLSEFDIHD